MPPGFWNDFRNVARAELACGTRWQDGGVRGTDATHERGQMTGTEQADVLVVGAGPAGASAAAWAARTGAGVVLADAATFPRDKTCGDGLTPRAVRSLRDMGLEDRLATFHRHRGLRTVAHGITLELPWP